MDYMLVAMNVLNHGFMMGDCLVKNGTYGGTEIGLLCSSSDGTGDWKFEVSVDGIELGTNEGTKLGLRDGRVIGAIFCDTDGIPLGAYYGLDIGLLEGSTYRRTKSNLEGLLLVF